MAVEGPVGVAVIDKPAGLTSHDVVARARKHFGTRKVGHSGTLDPGATGVLVLGVGRATRLLRFLTALPKRYTTTVVLGVETDTLDDSGSITVTHEMGHVTEAAVRAAAAGFVGEILQVPPMVSARRVGGRRLHELAREGVEVEREARPVTIHHLDVDAVDVVAGTFEIDVTASSGTYVRTLAADIGAALGGGAHLRDLRRRGVGSFDESSASPLEDAELLAPAEALRDYPAVVAADDVAAAVCHGKVLDAGVLGVDGDGPWAVLDVDGSLLAVYEQHGSGRVKPAVVIAPAG